MSRKTGKGQYIRDARLAVCDVRKYKNKWQAIKLKYGHSFEMIVSRQLDVRI